jgi:hypothetical protein
MPEAIFGNGIRIKDHQASVLQLPLELVKESINSKAYRSVWLYNASLDRKVRG